MSNEQGLIEKINRKVNALNLRETVDEGTGPMLGGCRQYVLEKQRQLIAAGIDPSRLEPSHPLRRGTGTPSRQQRLTSRKSPARGAAPKVSVVASEARRE